MNKIRKTLTVMYRPIVLLEEFIAADEDNARTAPIMVDKDNLEQGRSYRRINDTGPPSYRVPNICNYNLTKRAPISKKGHRRNFDTGPLAELATPVIWSLFNAQKISWRLIPTMKMK
ncbi:hypothetical protein TNCV_1192961 [Trichonephila clavipes]|nr:hypothetical protein TNCV_1192961 [Trichonephila clavipes]